MSKKTSYLLGILLTIIIGTYCYHKYCCSCTNCNGETTIVANESAMDTKVVVTINQFKLNGDGFDYQCNDNFKFMKDGFKTILPVSDSIDHGIDNLKMFFDKNPNQRLLITGYATSNEKNTSAYPNLGFARANDIKNYYISKGFPASKFDIHGEVRASWEMSGDTLLGPAYYKIFVAEASDTVDWNALKIKLNEDPLILYFNTGQAEINLSLKEREKVAALVNYLDHVSDSKLNTVGHTDAAGNRNVNLKLGLDRANFARDYLAKNGVDGNRIEVSSKGSEEPIADNKTQEGKAKNRRTVVTIK